MSGPGIAPGWVCDNCGGRSFFDDSQCVDLDCGGLSATKYGNDGRKIAQRCVSAPASSFDDCANINAKLDALYAECWTGDVPEDADDRAREIFVWIASAKHDYAELAKRVTDPHAMWSSLTYEQTVAALASAPPIAHAWSEQRTENDGTRWWARDANSQEDDWAADISNDGDGYQWEVNGIASGKCGTLAEAMTAADDLLVANGWCIAPRDDVRVTTNYQQDPVHNFDMRAPMNR